MSDYFNNIDKCPICQRPFIQFPSFKSCSLYEHSVYISENIIEIEVDGILLWLDNFVYYVRLPNSTSVKVQPFELNLADFNFNKIVDKILKMKDLS
ncbi:MAG: hypothetical protein LC122_12180 [Chitinophagales bacterium]|nr:hypothetical protein [Chitinophagales bacterium]